MARTRSSGAHELSPASPSARGRKTAAAPASPRATLHAWAKPHKYDKSGCPIYTRAEVIGDTVVHCVGVPFAFTAAYVMISTATARLGEERGPAEKRTLFGLYVFSTGLIMMLTASAIYNIFGCGLKFHTQVLRRIDHACIYFMISGSYTPFLLMLPPGAVSSRVSNDRVLACIWAVAVTGAVLKVVLARRFETAGLLLYVCLGCTVVSFTHAVTEGCAGGTALLKEFVKSGACYLFGLIFYLDDEIPFSNALWHSCVLAGAVLHTIIVYNLVAKGDHSYPL